MGHSDCPFGSRDVLRTPSGDVTYWRLGRLEELGLTRLDRLPYSIKVLLESTLRQLDGEMISEDDVRRLAAWSPGGGGEDLPFIPARVILQDFTGVPAVVDLASMRDAMSELGGDPSLINPSVPADLVIDHSVWVDNHGTCYAREMNEEREMERNRERYSLLKWAQGAFRNFRVVPPGNGIIHQVNLEHLAPLVHLREEGGETVAYPDSVFGTDSHTTQINGLGVLGWGVGGIEAEAVMLGQPYYMRIPEVIGVRLTGELGEGVTATDLVLTVVEMLRRKGVVGKFVEFFGPGMASLSLPDRATLANMGPEYGATMGFFPVDGETLRYLRQTGRNEEHVDLVERYVRAQGLFYDSEPDYSDTLELDLGSVEPSLAGHRRPQDRVPLGGMARSFDSVLGGMGRERRRRVGHLADGSVVIASITSCTNTSNPSVMIAAGLLARNAVERGLRPKAHVKTSLSPGSKAVTGYLDRAGLTPYLDALGFHLTGYGCMTCIGNSGPLVPGVDEAVRENDLVAAAVVSANRNFEGRVHPLVKANYLASPPLVVAFAIAGRVDIDLTSEPLAIDPNGREVYLDELWPSREEVEDLVSTSVDASLYRREYADVFKGSELWDDIAVPEGDRYAWDEASTYIRNPPFFDDMPIDAPEIESVRGARALAVLGDSITTDHISPAGSFSADSEAGRYLIAEGVDRRDFNSYGSRRGNHEVLMRGAFANIRLRNRLAEGREGGWTRHMPSGEMMSIFAASRRYREEGVPLIVLAGKEYGTGSSRDWAAKGPHLLGVRAVIAESFERIHRSNLIGMGVLPLQFKEGQSAEELRLDGSEEYDIDLSDLRPKGEVRVVARKDGREFAFDALVRLDVEVEMEYYRNGGILQTVLRNKLP